MSSEKGSGRQRKVSLLPHGGGGKTANLSSKLQRVPSSPPPLCDSVMAREAAAAAPHGSVRAFGSLTGPEAVVMQRGK